MSSKVTMAESKERQSMLQMRVSISTVSTLKDLDGTEPRRDSKTLTQKSFIINSQFSTSPLSLQLSQLVVLQVPAKPLDKEQLTLRKPFTHAQFTNTQ